MQNMYGKVVAGLLIAVLMVPAASALTVAVPPSESGEDPVLYVHVDEESQPGDTGIYEETNGCEGLQTTAGDCDDDGVEEQADNRLAP